MIWTVTEEQLFYDATKNAGGKARNDVRDILLSLDVKELVLQCPQVERQITSGLKKVMFHYSVLKDWNKLIKKFKAGDSLVLQFPVINHTLFLNSFIRRVKKKGVKIVAVIHDLELLRISKAFGHYSRAMRWRLKREEMDELNEFDAIIVHNEKMKGYMAEQLGINREKMVTLGIFDYLIPEGTHFPEAPSNYKSCIIAGNLKRTKSEYIYNLPSKPEFELYGANYDGNTENNIHYNGSFLPEELVEHLVGGFGLVWDGDSPDTCSGTWGEYLKYNNPHKTSLYLACGIPVIIWKEAALAEYIEANNVGLTVYSLYELDDVLTNLTYQDYEIMRKNARTISRKLRDGYYTKKALDNALSIVK